MRDTRRKVRTVGVMKTLPKAVIEEANLGDEVELIVRKDEVVLRRVKKVREGWAEDFKHMAKHEKLPVDEFGPTHFDLYEHEWPMEDFGLKDE